MGSLKTLIILALFCQSKISLIVNIRIFDCTIWIKGGDSICSDQRGGLEIIPRVLHRLADGLRRGEGDSENEN